MKTNTKKSTKYTFIADLTNAHDPEDVKFEFIRGKAKAGVKLTDEEIMWLVKLGSKITLEAIEESMTKMKPVACFDNVDANKVKKIVKILTKKEPWYKRFWNWITRKK
jgi:CTP:phosphocholine cytidylyltransferase-like protein